MSHRRPHILPTWPALLLLSLPILAACAATPDANPGPSTGGPRVIATTTLIGDVARQIGGPELNLTVLLPVGADPHTYQVVPQDLTAVARADLILVNGFALEAPLDDLLTNAAETARIVTLSDGITPLLLADGDLDHEDVAHEVEADHDDEHAQGEADPHTWFDVANVMIWTDAIAAALADVDPTYAATYQANAAAYRAALEELDRWILDQVASVPADARLLVTDHAVLGYFARRYGFEQVGAIIPTLSTASSPSASQLAELESAIDALDVPAVLVGNSFSQSIARQVSDDTGIQVVIIYTGTLSDPDGPAPTYLDFMRYNVSQIVQALRSPTASTQDSP